MSDRIDVESVVNVFFDGRPAIWGPTVLYTPAATGDSWRLRGKDGKLYAVQFFAYMEEVTDE